jgi:hypothetical protein
MYVYVYVFLFQARLKRFVGDRGTGGQEVYGAKLQAAHHIHVPGDDNYRILQHHYGRSIPYHTCPITTTTTIITIIGFLLFSIRILCGSGDAILLQKVLLYLHTL